MRKITTMTLGAFLLGVLLAGSRRLRRKTKNW